MPKDNVLYLTVLPLVPIGSFWATQEQTREYLTLFPNPDFATEFFPDEVDTYIATFLSRAQASLTGGHVVGYSCQKETTLFGRVRVRVIQHVQ